MRDDGNKRGQKITRRLYDARHILAVAALLAFGLVASGYLVLWQVLVGLGALFLAAAVPVRSRAARKRERLLQRERSEPLEAVVFATCETLADPAFILASGSILKYQNRAAVEQFGQMTAGAHLSSRMRAPVILDIVQQTMTTGDINTIEYVEKVPAERWYLVRVAPMTGFTSMKGGRELYMLTFRDLSESRRIDRMRSDFIANASHELRTPLASLFGFIETLRGPAKNDPIAREKFLTIMYEQASRMTRLVDDLLSLSRLEIKAHMQPTEDVDIIPLISHICDTLKPLAEELNVNIEVASSDDTVLVTGDRDELIQVFENLIENACKYGQSGKKVDVRIDRLNDAAHAVQVVVKDYGPGIPKEDVSRLTERFYRVSVEASRSKKGTGLGLAIVKHILTRHRARLAIHSVLGEGAEFTVIFNDQKR